MPVIANHQWKGVDISHKILGPNLL
jgi:hypothetical protein